MRKTIIAALLLGASLPAVAQDYTFLVVQKQNCEFAAERSFNAFNLKQQGQPMQVIRVEDVGWVYPIQKYAVEYGYNSAVNKEDAYMHSWAKCMDNFEWLANYHKRTKKIPEHLHY